MDGFDAIGHPIPHSRLSAGYRAVKQMIPDISTEAAMALVGRMADRLERDEPYAALFTVTGAPFERNPDTTAAEKKPDGPLLDVTGGYRLMAHLLTDGS